MNNLAAIIVDMQEDFLKDVSNDRRKNLINSQLIMIDYFMERDIPILNVEFRFGKSTDMNIHEKISNYAPKSFKKESANAFSNTNLINQINTLGIKNLYFMGVCTDLCIASSMAFGSIQCNVYTSDDVVSPRDHVYKNHPTFQSRKCLFMNGVSKYLKSVDRSKVNYLENKSDFLELIKSKD